jgi:hypothetical protein
MKRFTHIVFRLLLAFIPVMLSLPQARAQGDTVCVGSTSLWAVVEVPGDSYVWELYNDVEGLNLAVVPGNCPVSEAYFVGGVNTGDSVEVMCLELGTYFIKVTATNGCPTNNLKIGMIVVEECYSYATLIPDTICEGETAMFTLEMTGAPGPWVVTFTDGTTTWTEGPFTDNPHVFPLIPTPPLQGNYNYYITSVANPYMTNETTGDPVTLIVRPKPVTSPIYRY